jgi:hypothetical protein
MIKSNCEQLQEVRVAEELDVPRSADKGVEVGILDAKDYVDPTYARGFNRTQHTVHHFAYEVFLLFVFQLPVQDRSIFLNPGWTEGHVLILRGTDEGDLLKFIKTAIGG